MRLLTRDHFREKVLSRDNYTCNICRTLAIDAHHIMERKLFSNGGYFVENGVALCSDCHLRAERTDIDPEYFFGYVILPDHLNQNTLYDKWGNERLPNGKRMKGELFYDDSVQKILADKMHLFIDYIKYPRTYHLPWSNTHSDDKILKNTDHFIGKRVVVTEKLDGENTTLYRDYFHARSIDSKNHPSRNWAKAFHAGMSHEIPPGWRFCCENMFAKHSVGYNDLDSYLYGLSIWNDKNICLPWDETVEIFSCLDIPTPCTFTSWMWNEEYLQELAEKLNPEECEGYVVRLADSFSYRDFKTSVAKYVRKNHVQTDEHWMTKPIERNILK